MRKGDFEPLQSRLVKRRSSSGSHSPSDSEGSAVNGESVPMLRRSGSMTNVHYQPFVTAAVAMYVYGAREAGQPITAKRHYSHDLDDEQTIGFGSGTLQDHVKPLHAGAALERLRAQTYAQPVVPLDASRERSATIEAGRPPCVKKQSSAVVKSTKGSLKGSIESMPDTVTLSENFEKKTATKALEDEYGFERVSLYTDKDLDQPARGRRSPRTASGARTLDTLVSVDDAEPTVFAEAEPDFINALRELPSDRPVHIDIEFHGSDGSCGASEADEHAEGCKGRAWRFSQTLADEFLKSQASSGATLTASSYYLQPTKETTRRMPKKRLPKIGITEMEPIATYYGYKTGVTRVLYGAEADPALPRMRGKSYELYKRVIGQWEKP